MSDDVVVVDAVCMAQVYMVEERLRADALQRLALFSEYGRMAHRSPAPHTESHARDSVVNVQLDCGGAVEATGNGGHVGETGAGCAGETGAVTWPTRFLRHSLSNCKPFQRYVSVYVCVYACVYVRMYLSLCWSISRVEVDG